jgi:hypothetical protein
MVGGPYTIQQRQKTRTYLACWKRLDLEAIINKAKAIQEANKAIKRTFKFSRQAPQYTQQAIQPPEF